MGVLFKRIKQYDKAVEYFRRALEIYPKDSDVLIQIAEIYRITNKYDEAIKYYRKAIEINPQNYKAVGFLGHAFY